MIKSRLWREVLDLEICWRFFKYKLVLDDTCNKFIRDTEYLQESETREESSQWRLPCKIETVLHRIRSLSPDIESLKTPLAEINHMIRFCFVSLLIGTHIISYRSKRRSSPLVLAIIVNIWH